MQAPRYSYYQLQKIAEELLYKFNPVMLDHPVNDFDVYEVVERCLGVPYDWKYLSADGSILGMTAFESGYIPVWDEVLGKRAKSPKRIFVEENTILIDRRVNEGKCRGRENFTVMHEVFHQILHRAFFKDQLNSSFIGYHRPQIPHYALNGHRLLETEADWVEWQADTCAACFLMPEELVRREYQQLSRIYMKWLPDKQFYDGLVVAVLAEMFHVSHMAMCNRLNKLKLVSA